MLSTLYFVHSLSEPHCMEHASYVEMALITKRYVIKTVRRTCTGEWAEMFGCGSTIKRVKTNLWEKTTQPSV